MSRNDSESTNDVTFQTEARAVLFGFDPSAVSVVVRPRTRSWRVGGAVRTVVVFLVVAPVVAVVPPHAPWAVAALAAGVLLARRRMAERFTLERVEGVCPKCGEPLSVKRGRLRAPHPIPCETCHHESSLRIGEDVLRANGAEPA